MTALELLELALSRKNSCCKIAITLKSPLRSKPQSGSVNWGTTCKTEGSELSISRKPPHKYAACYRFLPVTLE
jgi:hypothetical protein